MKNDTRIYGLQTISAILENYPTYVIKLFYNSKTSNKRIISILNHAKSLGISIENVKNFGKNPSKEHQPLMIECKKLPSFDETDLDSLVESRDYTTFVILDGITDPHNLGAILRTSVAMDVTAVIAPKNNSVGLTPTVRNVASGGAELMPFIRVSNLARTLRQLKEKGVWLYGADANAKTMLFDVKFPQKVGLIFGREHEGIKHLTKKECDEIISIPLFNAIDSLNVSVAAGMFLYQAMQRKS